MPLYSDKNRNCEDTSVVCVLQLRCLDGFVEIRASVSNDGLRTKLTEFETPLTSKLDVLNAVTSLREIVYHTLRVHEPSVKSDDVHASRRDDGKDVDNITDNEYDSETDEYQYDEEEATNSTSTSCNSKEHARVDRSELLAYTKANKKIQDTIKYFSFAPTKLEKERHNVGECNTNSKKTFKIKLRRHRCVNSDDVGRLEGHPKDFPLKCTYCKLLYKKRYSLLEHIRSVHTGIPSIARPYECSECGRTFGMIHILCQHLYVHKADDEKPFRCIKHCNKRFNTKNQLLHHEMIYQNIRPYRCEKCGKMWSSGAALKDHMVVHSNERPHLCSECGQSFRRKSQLTRHYFQHSERKYQCDKCGKAFPTMAAVKRHSVIHDANRIRFKCTHCDVSLTKPSHLNRHIRNVHKNLVSRIHSTASMSTSNADASTTSELSSSTLS